MDKNLKEQLSTIAWPNEKFKIFQKYIVVSSQGRVWRFKKFGLGNKAPHLRALIGAPAGQQKKYRQIRDDYGKLRYISNVIWLAWNNADELPYGYEVHHINCNVDDNRIQNLTLLDKKSHLKLHYAAKKGCANVH